MKWPSKLSKGVQRFFRIMGRYWPLLAGIALAVAALAGPLLIDYVYQMGGGIALVFEETDLLAYYGRMIAAAVTMLGVFLSIQFAQRNYRQDVERGVLPYLAVIIDDVSVTGKMEEASYVAITNNAIRGCREILELTGEKKIQRNKDMMRLSQVHEGTRGYFIRLQFSNAGVGAALNTRLKVQTKGGEDDAILSTLPINLMRREKIHYGLAYIWGDMDQFESIRIEFTCEDIYQTQYRHRALIDFSDFDGKKESLRVEIVGQQRKRRL